MDLAVQWATPARADLQRHADAGSDAGPAELHGLLQGSEVVGRQTVAQEAERGSDTFARTATHATATLTATVSSVQKPKAAVSLLKALRGYALLLWMLVNFIAGKSHLGRNVTSLIVGVGGTLVALAVVVPGIPIALPLTGVVLVLATASVSALLGRKDVGWVFAWRFGFLLVLAAAALVLFLAFAASDDKQRLWQLLRDVGPELALVAAVIAIGWFLGRPTKRDPAPTAPTPRGNVMTTLSDRPNTALMVIDVQNGVVGRAPTSATRSSPTSARSSTGLAPRASRSSGSSTPTTTWCEGARPGSTSRSSPRRSRSRWCTRRSGTPSRTPTWRRCWPRPASDAWS